LFVPVVCVPAAGAALVHDRRWIEDIAFVLPDKNAHSSIKKARAL
jgi:hypothetical protein